MYVPRLLHWHNLDKWDNPPRVVPRHLLAHNWDSSSSPNLVITLLQQFHNEAVETTYLRVHVHTNISPRMCIFLWHGDAQGT